MGSIWWIVESLKKSYCWISAREMLWHALLIFYKKVTRSFAPYCQAKMDKVNCNLCISSQIWRSKNKTRRTRTVLFHIHARPITRAEPGVRRDSALQKLRIAEFLCRLTFVIPCKQWFPQGGCYATKREESVRPAQTTARRVLLLRMWFIISFEVAFGFVISH